MDAPFKVRLIRPPFEVEFEAGSIGEANAILSAEGTEIQKLFGMSFGEPQGDEAPAAEPATEPKKRGRKPAVEAVAPPPMPVPPAAAPPPPVDATPGPNGIPAFLDRTTPPPPPLLPPAAAPPVAPPISGPVGQKVIAYCEPHLNGPDKGQALADWFAGAGLTIKGATLGEVIAVIRMTTDDKLAAVATALAV